MRAISNEKMRVFYEHDEAMKMILATASERPEMRYIATVEKYDELKSVYLFLRATNSRFRSSAAISKGENGWEFRFKNGAFVLLTMEEWSRQTILDGERIPLTRSAA